jgi:putative nucleotidyltransferase with HDIG domain
MPNEKTAERYAKIIESIDQLPTLPAVVTMLLEVVNSPTTSAEDAAGLIGKDPALTSRMLRLANSAFYGIPRTISSVSSAVVILGFNTMKSLVLSASVMEVFSGKGGKTVVFERSRFWKHSIVTAMAAKHIIRSFMHVKMIDPESAFCAGILHDIGKLVFEQHVRDDYTETCDYARKTATSTIEAESHVMGITHAEVGRALAAKWALPMELESAIIFHHDPAQVGAATVKELVAAVHCGDAIAHQLKVGLWDDETAPTLLQHARSTLHLDDDAYNRIVNQVRDELEKSDEFLAIIS